MSIGDNFTGSSGNTGSPLGPLGSALGGLGSLPGLTLRDLEMARQAAMAARERQQQIQCPPSFPFPELEPVPNSLRFNFSSYYDELRHEIDQWLKVAA